MPKKKKQFFYKKKGKKNTTDPSSPGAGTSQHEPNPGADSAGANTLGDELDPYLKFFFPKFSPENFEFLKTSQERRRAYRDFRDVVKRFACEGIGMVQLFITFFVVAAAVGVIISGSRDEAFTLVVIDFWNLPNLMGDFISYHTGMHNFMFLVLERCGFIASCVVASLFYWLMHWVMNVQLQRTNEHRQALECYGLYTFGQEILIPINWYIMRIGMLLVLSLPNAIKLFEMHVINHLFFKAVLSEVTFYSPYVFKYFAAGFVVIYRFVARSYQFLIGLHHASRLGMDDTYWITYNTSSFLGDMILMLIVWLVFNCYPLLICFCSELNGVAFNYYAYTRLCRSVA